MEIHVNNAFDCESVYKIFHVYQSVSAAVLYRNGSESKMSYRTIFLVAGIAILIDGVLIRLLPFPVREKKSGEKQEKSKVKLTKVSWAAVLIGFTSSSTFMLWLN